MPGPCGLTNLDRLLCDVACVHRLLVFGGSGGRASHVLELRTWRLQPVGLLSSERQHMVSQHTAVCAGLVTAWGPLYRAHTALYSSWRVCVRSQEKPQQHRRWFLSPFCGGPA